MTESDLYWTVIVLLNVSALISFGLLLFVSAPYGRHERTGWGPTLPSRLGWILMESPAVFLFIGIYISGTHRAALVPLILCGLWQFHYIYRTLIYPFRLKAPSKPMPVSVMGLAFLFQCANSYVNARWISELGPTHSYSLNSAHLMIGLGLFALGWALNQWSDHILLNLRKPGETGYKIPYGGGFYWVTCPNYLGELIAWCGWACIAWSWAGWTFAVFTAANLIPRALQHHQWIRNKFTDYPTHRRAILPYLV